MHNPAHLGEVLREWIPETMTVTTATEQLGVSRVTLTKILNRKAGVSAEMALRLAAWLGTSPEVWLEMQTVWDLWQAEQKPIPEMLALVLPFRLAAQSPTDSMVTVGAPLKRLTQPFGLKFIVTTDAFRLIEFRLSSASGI